MPSIHSNDSSNLPLTVPRLPRDLNLFIGKMPPTSSKSTTDRVKLPKTKKRYRQTVGGQSMRMSL